MKKQEIIKLLIDYYIECIIRMPFFGWRKYIIYKNIHDGVCYTANIQFAVYTYDQGWIDRHKSFIRIYWYKTPITSNNYFSCIWRLYQRVRILKKEYKIIE